MKDIPLNYECPECGEAEFVMPTTARGQVKCAKCGEKLGTVKQLNKSTAVSMVAKDLRKEIKKAIRGTGVKLK